MSYTVSITVEDLAHLDLSPAGAAAEVRNFVAEARLFAPHLFDPNAGLTEAQATYAEAIIVGAIERRTWMTAKVTTEAQGRQSLTTRNAAAVKWDPERFTQTERDALIGLAGTVRDDAAPGPLGGFPPAWDYQSLFARPRTRLP